MVVLKPWVFNDLFDVNFFGFIDAQFCVPYHLLGSGAHAVPQV